MTEQHHIAQHHIPQDDIPQDDIPPNDIPQDDEVIGHVLREGHAEADETDDVTGHLSGALGSKKKAEDQA